MLVQDGTLHVGNAAQEFAVISRKSELRYLRVELQEAVARLDGRAAPVEDTLVDHRIELLR